MTFWASKLLWIAVQPDTLILLLAGLAILLGLGRRWRRAARRLGLLLAALLIAIGATTLAEWPARVLEDRFPPVAALPDSAAGIVVLGGAIDPAMTRARGAPALSDAAERVTETVRLSRRYPAARVVFTGGSGNPFQPYLTEGPIARSLLADLGVEPARLLVDERSRNTHENALYARELARPQAGETWLLVTSALHMPRAVGAFRAAGWRPLPYPVDFRTKDRGWWGVGIALAAHLDLLAAGAHEWIGLVAYRLLGWSDDLFPGP